MAQADPDAVTLQTFTVTGTSEVDAIVLFTPSITETQSSADDTLLLKPVVAQFVDGVLIGPDDEEGVKLIANTSQLGTLPTLFTYRVDYRQITHTLVSFTGKKYRRIQSIAWRDGIEFPADDTDHQSFRFLPPGEYQLGQASGDYTVDLDDLPRLITDFAVKPVPMIDESS